MISTWQRWRGLTSAKWLGIGLVTALALLFAARPGHAGARWEALADTVFQNYGRDQGLPHPVPTALAQSRDGFLWIGTQGGLARWDGYRFRSYKANPAVPGSLPDDWVQSLHVDAAGRLWVGGGAGGLARYDAEMDRFEPVPLKPATERTHIGAILDDGAGGLWVGADDGLHHLNPATGVVTAQRAAGLPDGTVQSLLRDRTGALWVGTPKGLARRAAGAETFTPVTLSGEAAGIARLLLDADGRVWIGTMRRGLFVSDNPDVAPRPVGGGSPLPWGSISSLCIAGPNEVWAGLRGGGIVAVDTRTLNIRPIRHDQTLPNSLAHDDVWAMMSDDAGSVWVGSTGGLSYHPADPGLISTVFGPSQRPAGLSGADVMSILPTRDGRVWIGYLNGSVDIIDPIAGRLRSLRPDPANPDGALQPDVIFAMTEDAAGAVYVGSRRGLYRIDPATGEVRLTPVPGREPRASVTALRFDAGLLWVGGEEDGLWSATIGSPGKGLVEPVRRLRLSDTGIQIIRRGAGSEMWIGTRNGLNLLNLDNLGVEHILAMPADPAALPARFVTCILRDRQERLWIGTFGGGVAVMTGRGTDGRPRFHRLGIADGLPHMNVDSLEMDGGGTIWAGTDDGLALIDPQTLSVRPVRRADGAPLVDYFAGAGATTPAGEGLFGAKGGFTVTRPGVLPPWRFHPPLVITDLRVGGVPTPAGRFNAGTATQPLILTPQTNSLAVEFAALDFTAPDRNRHAYKLDGVDSDWVQADVSRRLAVYGNLAPGDYTLRLRGSNRDGLWTERELVLPIRVLPAWYQHPWVRGLVVILLIAAVMGLVRWRTAYLRTRQAVLERQIADRTADLRAANERLAQLAMIDTLTGCANRRHFMERALDMASLAARHGTPLSLAVLDLDEFKRINDIHGHPGGDAALAMAGGILCGHLRGADVVGRMGGEEFALLMPHTDAAGALIVAERLRTAIEGGAVMVDGDSIRITASLGVAELRPGEDFTSLYSRADAALYDAKLTGRNRVVAAAAD